MDMGKVNDWLEGIPSKNTRKSYLHGIKKFEEFYGKGIETLIGSENAGKVIEKFYVKLKEKYTQNTCRNMTNSPIQFLKFHDTVVKYRRALQIYRTVPTTRDHRLTIDEVQSMAKVSDLREQILLEVLLLGLRIGDISTFEWMILDVNGKPPIPIEILTKKEEVIARTFISKEFKELFDKYLQTIDQSNPYLFQTTRKSKHLSGKRINDIFKDLGKRAGIKSHGLFRWHIGRKLFLRTCAELGINQWNAKMMCGKSVSVDISTYINGVELKADFNKLSNVLRLRSDPDIIQNSQSKISDLESNVKLLMKEKSELKHKVELLESRKSMEDFLKEFSIEMKSALTEAFKNSKQISMPIVNGKEVTEHDHIVELKTATPKINGAELITLRTLAKLFMRKYNESKSKEEG